MSSLTEWLRSAFYWNEQTRAARVEQAALPAGGARRSLTPRPSVADQLAALTARGARTAETSSAAVYRARALTAGTVAQLIPEVFRGGERIDSPPIVARPNPFITRYRFLYETVASMIDSGSAVWHITARDSAGSPTAMSVLDPATYTIESDDRYRPRIRVGERILRAPADHSNDADAVVIALNPRAGEPGGRSPLSSEILDRILSADYWAASFYDAGAVPSGILSAEGHLTPEEASELKARFVEAHAARREPAVLGGGLTYQQTIANPVDAQLSDARDHSVREVARLFGIPAPMLLATYGGSSLTYSNLSSLFGEFLRATVTPWYLAPIEAAWSDLVPRTQSVRFSTDELERADLGARWQAYSIGLERGVFTIDEVRRLEGISSSDLPPSHLMPSSPPTANAPIPREVDL